MIKWSKPKIICKKLRAKNSKQLGDVQDASGPSDPIVPNGWVRNSVCL